MSHGRYAYCIGANGPQSSWYDPLKYAEKDAERLANALATSPCNFSETRREVATNRSSTLAGLNQFVKQCQSADLLVIHFSGHAILDQELYLLCNESDCDDLVSSAIEIGAVKKILSRSLARYNLLILDCCHAGGAHREAFKGEQDVQNILNKTFQGSASVILSACARHERTRELETLDGGAGFLSWALATACTAYFHKVSRDGRSLSLADVLRWIPLALTDINCSLNEIQQLPLPEALIYTRGGDGDIWFTEPGGQISSKIESNEQNREPRLRAMLADHSGFMRDRLSTFVGRSQELAEIRRLITEKQQTGGYITITGYAGQGKSSIIAKLVEQYGPEKVAFHFIPFNPGPDHQVGLLRNLMARLILKYNLSDLYVASESRPALRDYFPRVLEEVMTRGGLEVIFVDGLDQLEEEHTGLRDLSFLPNNPPSGIVFVLGTRPNDTLKPLELLKPRGEYKLPNLSRKDFDLILRHRQVSLETGLVDQFYHVMQANALYLDLVAKELRENRLVSPQKIIIRIANNPENIFSLAISRLKRPATEWREVIKPLFGLLLAAREPLDVRSIRQVLGVEDEQLREGILRLGGLLAEDGQHRYSLFHLKLFDYLRQDEHNPTKEYMFATDEEEGWHKRLAQWCEQVNLPIIWLDMKQDQAEQKRRIYARHHFITHLYLAKEWQQLFKILDEAQYGRAKVNYDPSTRLYAQDLDLGRQAAADERWTMEELLVLLPHLWRYTLLRCSLASRADRYPIAAFRLLVLLDRQEKAIGLAELLTDPEYKVNALLQIAIQIGGQYGKEEERVEVLVRAYEVAHTIADRTRQVQVLHELARALIQARQWERAEAVIPTIAHSDKQAEALCELGQALIQVGQWERAEAVIQTIADRTRQVQVLYELARALIQARQWERVEAVIPTIMHSDVQSRALRELSYTRAKALHEQARVLIQARQWERAEEVIPTIMHSDVQSKALYELRRALLDAQQWDRAEALIETRVDRDRRFEALRELGQALMQAQQWERAEAVIQTTVDTELRAEALCELGSSLAQAEHWEQAETVWKKAEIEIGRITNNSARTEALSKLDKRRAMAILKQADSLTQIQQWERAEAVIQTIASFEMRIVGLCTLGRKLTISNQRKRVKAFWERVETVIYTIANSYMRIAALCTLVRTLSQARQWERAENFLNKAKTEVNNVKDNYLRAQAFHELRDAQTAILSAQGRALVQTGQWKRANKVINLIEDDNLRTEVLCELLIVLAQDGQWEQAKQMINSIEDDGMLVEVLCGMGRTLAKADQSEQTEVFWKEAEAVISSMTHSFARIEVLHVLGNILGQSGQWERAAFFFREAEKIVRTENGDMQEDFFEETGEIIDLIEDGDEQIRGVIDAMVDENEVNRDMHNAVLRALGMALAHTEQWEQAEGVINKIEDPVSHMGALRELGAVLASENKIEEYLCLVQHYWLQAATRESALQLLLLAYGLIFLKPEIGTDFSEAFAWVDFFLKGW